MSPRMSDSERVIMDIIWNGQEKQTPSQVLESLPPEYTWKYKTVATFLTRLVDKGLLSCEKEGKTNRYTANISKEAYLKDITKHFLNEFHSGSVKHLVATLYDDPIEKNKIQALFDLIDKEG